MDIFLTILKAPLLQILGLSLVLIILKRAGIDVLGLVLGKNGKEKTGERMDTLEQHFNHELTDTLLRIEHKLEKLDDISEGIIYLKAKQKNGQ